MKKKKKIKKKKTKKVINLTVAFAKEKEYSPIPNVFLALFVMGLGRIKLTKPYFRCKECGGMGKKRGTNLYCLSCQGKGFVEKNNYAKKEEGKKIHPSSRLRRVRARFR